MYRFDRLLSHRGRPDIPVKAVPVKAVSPEEAQAHFTWFASLVGRDVPASSELTKKQLGWEPTGLGT